MADTIIPFNAISGLATGITATTVVDQTGALQGSVITGINGLTGHYKSLFGANSVQSTAVGLTAQLDYIAFNDFESQVLSASAASNGGVWALGNANGGSATVGSTTQITNFGANKCFGVATISTGTSNVNTGYSGVVMQSNLLPGIILPTNGFVTKYDYEILWRTDATTHTDAAQVYYRAGFSNTWTNATPTDGVYFEFAGVTAAQADTQWQVVFTNGGSSERFATGVTMTASKTYKMDLSVERSTAGTVTTSYTVTNVTDNFTSTASVSPVNSARLITGTTDYATPGCSINKTGTATTTSRLIQLDYIGARIRRPIERLISIL